MLCLFALVAAMFPRLALLFLWLFTNLVSRAFHGSFILPLLGIIFLPFTTLMYVLTWTAPGGVVGLAWFWVILGLLVDLSSYASGGYSNRRRIPGAAST